MYRLGGNHENCIPNFLKNSTQSTLMKLFRAIWSFLSFGSGLWIVLNGLQF